MKPKSWQWSGTRLWFFKYLASHLCNWRIQQLIVCGCQQLTLIFVLLPLEAHLSTFLLIFAIVSRTPYAGFKCNYLCMYFMSIKYLLLFPSAYLSVSFCAFYNPFHNCMVHMYVYGKQCNLSDK